jgi:hypothetical protein
MLMFTDFGIESQNVTHDLEPEKENYGYLVGKNIACIKSSRLVVFIVPSNRQSLSKTVIN